MPHILALINVIGGFMFLLGAVDFLSAHHPQRHIGSALFWGGVGCVLVLNGFRIFP